MTKRQFNFDTCLAMMRSRDPQAREDGFHILLPQAASHVAELMQAFEVENDHGLRCWLLELIGAAKSTVAYPLLESQLRSEDERLRQWAIVGLELLDTKQARMLLYQDRADGDGNAARG